MMWEETNVLQLTVYIGTLIQGLKTGVRETNHRFWCVQKFRKTNINFVVSVSLYTWNNLFPTGRIFMKCDIRVLLQNVTRIFDFHSNVTRVTGTFILKSRLCMLRMRHFPDKAWRQNQSTYFMFNNFFDIRATYNRTWSKILQAERPQVPK